MDELKQQARLWVESRQALLECGSLGKMTAGVPHQLWPSLVDHNQLQEPLRSLVLSQPEMRTDLELEARIWLARRELEGLLSRQATKVASIHFNLLEDPGPESLQEPLRSAVLGLMSSKK